MLSHVIYNIRVFAKVIIFTGNEPEHKRHKHLEGTWPLSWKRFVMKQKSLKFFFWPVFYKYSATSQNANISLFHCCLWEFPTSVPFFVVVKTAYNPCSCSLRRDGCKLSYSFILKLSDANATAFLLMLFQEEYRKRGFQEVVSPNIYSTKLWETSGHWQHYSVRH